MKLNTLRYLDRKIGIPLCYAAYFLKKALFLHNRHKFEKEKVKKILVIKIYGAGSIILASLVFQNLKKNFPNAEIWFLTKNGLDKIYPTKFFSHIETLNLKFLSAFTDFLRLVFKFRKQKFDLVIDLEIVSRYTALLSYLSGAKTKVGFEIMGQNKDKLYDFKAIYHEGKHISKVFLSALEVLDLDIKKFSAAAPEFSLLDKESVLDSFQIRNIREPYITININASELSFERRLPSEFFKQIICHIINNYKEYSIILIGSKDEKEYIENFMDLAKFSENNKVYNLAGNSFSELFALIHGAKLMITNDSGPAHIAAAYQTPAIVFFGPESPAIYGYDSKKVKNFYSETHCSPCLSVYRDKKFKCVNNQKCLKNFNIHEINRAVDEFLK